MTLAHDPMLGPTVVDPPVVEPCPVCHRNGWVLEGDPDRQPMTLDLRPCPLPGCPWAGRLVDALAVHGAFARAHLHASTRAVMSLTGGRTPDAGLAAVTPVAQAVTPARVPSPSPFPPGAQPTRPSG